MNSLKLLLATCLVALSLSPLAGGVPDTATPDWTCQILPFTCSLL